MSRMMRLKDEATYREMIARNTRWQKGSQVVDTTAPVAHMVEPASKYRNQRTNGYASKREAKRAAELRALETAGVISDLQEQVPFLLVPKAIDEQGKVVERAASYIADFSYVENGARVVEDVKGMRTDLYRLKRKLLLMVYGIRIRET